MRREVATRSLTFENLVIPPRDPTYQVLAAERLDRDVLLLAMLPHMHLRGKSFRYEAISPDGSNEVILNVPRYDFHWQHRYELSKPKRLAAGTTLRCVGEYDNSIANPSNPDPDTTVRSGPRSVDEMFNGYYDIALADQDLHRPPSGFKPFQATTPGLLLAACGTVLVIARRRSAKQRRSSGGGLRLASPSVSETHQAVNPG